MDSILCGLVFSQVSHKLNKVFVDMEMVVPIQVKWDGAPNLFLRALMVFTEANRMNMPVQRCVTHRQKDSPTNARRFTLF